jgi:hypothetical protein
VFVASIEILIPPAAVSDRFNTATLVAVPRGKEDKTSSDRDLERNLDDWEVISEGCRSPGLHSAGPVPDPVRPAEHPERYLGTSTDRVQLLNAWHPVDYRFWNHVDGAG